MASNQVIPALPPGFELEGQSTPPPPEGFEIVGDKPAPSMLKDVAQSAVTGLRKGVLSIPAIPGDIMSGMRALEELLIRKSGIEPGTKQWDAYWNDPTTKAFENAKGVFPNSDDIQKFVTDRGSKFHNPETTAGKYAGAIAHGAGGNIVAKAKAIPHMMYMGAAGGAGGELASQLTEGNPLARFVGTLLAVTATGLPKALQPNSGKMIQEATEGLTPEQIAAANQAQAAGKSVGVDIMGPEALPQGPIQQLASDTMASKSGGRVISEFLEKRPRQITKAVTDLTNKIGTPEVPADTLNRAQKTATSVIEAEESARTAATRQGFRQSAKDAVSPNAIKRIGVEIDNAIGRVGESSESGKELAKIKARLFPGGSVETNVGRLHTLYKEAKEIIETPSINAGSPQKTIKGIVGPVVSKLGATLETYSPDLERSNALFARISKEVVDPIIQGDVGKIAGKGYDPQVTPPIQRILSVITDEKLSRPMTIRNVYSKLNAEDKKAFPQVVRLALQNAFDDAAKDVQAGTNRMLGANFKKAVYGTPQQRLNFIEMMAGVADANGIPKQDLQRGAVTLLDVLERTGKIPGIGSQTAGRLASEQMAKSSRVAGMAETVSAQPLTPIAKTLRDIAYRKAYKELADVFTSPNSVEKMLELSKYTPSSKKAQLLVAELLGAKMVLSDAGSDDTDNQEEKDDR